jgi:hypothetical protein
MNAINTTWDLALNRPYGDGGTEDSRRVDPEGGWTMLPPLYCEAHVNGPINVRCLPWRRCRWVHRRPHARRPVHACGGGGAC